MPSARDALNMNLKSFLFAFDTYKISELLKIPDGFRIKKFRNEKRVPQSHLQDSLSFHADHSIC